MAQITSVSNENKNASTNTDILSVDTSVQPPLGPVTHPTQGIKSIFTKDFHLIVDNLKRAIAQNRRNISPFSPGGSQGGHTYMTITLFDRAMDLVRYHGIWSLEVISKHLGLDDGALDAYCRRFPQARELYQTAREEFRTYMAQNALQRIFQLLDNPRADSRAKAALLTKLLEKFHPDMADKVEVKSTSLQDNRIQVVITDHSRPSASTPTPLPVSVAVEPPVAGAAEPPTPVKVEVYGPPVTTKTDEEIERALKSKNPGLALFSPNHRA